MSLVYSSRNVSIMRVYLLSKNWFMFYTDRLMAKILVLEKYLDGIIHIAELCDKLGCVERTAYRKIKRYRELWPPWLVHWLCGKSSNNKNHTRDNLKKYAMQTMYRDFWPTLFAEKMGEVMGSTISVETIRRRMIERWCWLPRKQKHSVKRQTRTRKEWYGVMVQFDGSYHDWIESWEVCCLLAAVDDATGDIIEATFTKSERLIDIIEFRENYFKKHGKPASIYLDRHSSYKVNHSQDQFSEEMLNRFQRAMVYLGIEVIYAKSAQWKWRVERKFAVLQDRGIKELRLAHIKNYETAQEYLSTVVVPELNKKFREQPKIQWDFHMQFTPKDRDYFERYFAKETHRIINNAWVIQYMNKKYQIPRWQELAWTKKVIILESHMGNIQIRSWTIKLPFTILSSS